MSIGSFVECRTRSVTLSIIRRSKPPRPCVDIAIRSQPLTLSAFVVPSSCSATSTMAPATSLSFKSDHVMERLRFFNFCCKCSVTPAIYVFAPYFELSPLCVTTCVKCKMPSLGAASAATRFAAGINAVSAKGEPSNATNAQTG